MKYLLIDTTTEHLVCAVADNGKIYDASEFNCGTNHSKNLCGAVEKALNLAGTDFAGLDAYACAVGPGSFTGIRIGISTVKGYCTAVPKPYVMFNRLHALCFFGNGRAALDAGNGYYYAEYRGLNEVKSPRHLPYCDKDAQSAFCVPSGEEILAADIKLATALYEENMFANKLSPLYIRRSQAEEKNG